MRIKSLMLMVLLFALVAMPGMATAQDAAAPADQKVKITISGSDTMNLLTQRLAEVYMKQHPNVEITVRGGGSGVGIRDLIDGLVDIAQASRKMKDIETERAQANGYDPQIHIVGLDGIAVAVNENSPVKELSKNQLKAIYTGAVTNWKQLNPEWPDARIVVFSRESSSGTYFFFKEHVMDDEAYTDSTSYLAATAAVTNAVKNEANGIGYGGVAYFVRTDGIRVLGVKADKDAPAVRPVLEDGHHVDLPAIQTGRYPISRTLQYYTRNQATGAAKDFLDWIKSDAGQKVVEEMEYIPLGSEAEKIQEGKV
jgi:phosphate transport system substrate-binding protein